ncbi:MAG TPA: GHMP kinase [Candidatus Thermoplasmatota archaeon]|nr:GHMP kinase [Candidatus Thermoplasmatota archaeon]
MIITRTPFRVSFVGGGTDLEAYYRSGHGSVVSTTLRKYMVVTVNRKFDDSIRVSYSQTEMVDALDQVRHELVREAMRTTGVTRGVEITTIADVPGRGTGLGSSSSLTVGLLHALYAHRHRHVGAARLAEEACRIEIDTLGAPIGKQDQYAAAYGGLNYIRFNADGSVFVDPIIFNPATRRELEGSLLMFFTGQTRSAGDILTEQKAKTSAGEKTRFLDAMRDQAADLRDALRNNDLTRFGDMLDKAWEMKRELAGGISNPRIDQLYALARKSGALGGKLLGAGGGGFLLFYAPAEKVARVREALADLKEMEFRFEPQGSKVIYVEEDT